MFVWEKWHGHILAIMIISAPKDHPSHNKLYDLNPYSSHIHPSIDRAPHPFPPSFFPVSTPYCSPLIYLIHPSIHISQTVCLPFVHLSSHALLPLQNPPCPYIPPLKPTFMHHELIHMSSLPTPASVSKSLQPYPPYTVSIHTSWYRASPPLTAASMTPLRHMVRGLMFCICRLWHWVINVRSCKFLFSITSMAFSSGLTSTWEGGDVVENKSFKGLLHL